ncbi:extracellular solute-binding protein [Gluconacetobacter sacchari]|uniref:Extracellular solute-binding protein n=2 Tax=Gluconacetobacter sacchari TaxID=92759 RepID=A0A7W4NSP3_9PROT|nr:extracellular solute-binding protein [Gluconacetobacter sacchari]MBB2162298.1 extracellular solute-binding protein [Gluconacetobacter sacchari]GBQ20377.1 sugar ABC transporter substrate-binding protein [Gluconacetobacter sacchari DSM 12717]
MRRGLSIILAGCALLFGQRASAGSLTVFCSSSGAEMALCRSETQAWSRATGNTVTLVPLLSDWGTILPLYRQLLSAQKTMVDILVMDGTWLGTLAPMLGTIAPAPDDGDLAPGPFVSAGREVALPWYRDIGLLFYRRDLLEKYRLPVPQSWDDLAAEARTIQNAERAHGDGSLWGYVWQGRTAESLICNALEWFGPAGGTIVAESGAVDLDNADARAALARAAGWIGTISPAGVLSDDEEAARGVFQDGHAVFMRNWVYAWALANDPQSPIAGKVGVAPLPRARASEPPRGVDGTVYLGMARGTAHPAEALSLMRYLTSRAVERARVVTGAYIPARRSLLDEPDVRAALPVLATIRSALLHPVLRPMAQTGVDYPRVAWLAANGFHDALRDRHDAPDTLHRLANVFEVMAHRGQWPGRPADKNALQEKTE